MSKKIVATSLGAAQGFRGDAHLYRLDPPMLRGDVSVEYVVASAVTAYSGPEVLILESNRKGEVLNWSEIDGQRGTLDHDTVMADAGFEVAR